MKTKDLERIVSENIDWFHKEITNELGLVPDAFDSVYYSPSDNVVKWVKFDEDRHGNEIEIEVHRMEWPLFMGIITTLKSLLDLYS